MENTNGDWLKKAKLKLYKDQLNEYERKSQFIDRGLVVLGLLST